MRDLLRNNQTFYYATYSANTQMTDASGYRTGERGRTYSTPVAMSANISPARGQSDVSVFGKDLDYSRVITTHDMSCPITETTILWIDHATTEPYDYIVVRIAKSLNSIKYAVKRVEVTA